MKVGIARHEKLGNVGEGKSVYLMSSSSTASVFSLVIYLSPAGGIFILEMDKAQRGLLFA